MGGMQRVARLGAAQHGVVTRAEVRAAGVSDRRIAALVGAGVLVRICPGVFRWSGAPVTWRQLAVAAVRASGPGALLSHGSAAALHGLAGFRPGRLHVVVPASRRRTGQRWTTHRAVLTPADRAVVDGIPVVAVSLALVHVAAKVSARRLEGALDDALCRGLVRLDQVTAACRSGRPGAAALRRAAELWRPEDRPASLAEARLFRRLHELGLPRPVLQHEVRLGDALVGRVDLAFPDRRVAVEYDSFRWHEPPRLRRATLARRNRLESLGWHVLVATAADRADGGRALAGALGRLLAPRGDQVSSA